MPITQTGNAMTLGDLVKNSKNPVTEMLVTALYKTQSFLKDVPVSSKSSLIVRGQRLEASGLPTVGYSSLNETPDKVRATIAQHEEIGWLIRENVYIDTRIKNAPDQITDPVDIQSKALMEAWARQMNADFIGNDPNAVGGNIKAPVGLKTRMLNILRYQQSAENFIDAGGLTVNTTTTATKSNKFFSFLDQMLDFMNAHDGNDVTFYMNDYMLRQVIFIARSMPNGTGLDITKDNYDRTIMTYKGAKLRDIGRKNDGTDATRIISNTETSDGTLDTTGTFTSIYGVHYGGEYLKGWHDGMMDLKYIGKDPSGTQEIFLLDYLLGLWHGHPRAICRLYDIGTPIG